MFGNKKPVSLGLSNIDFSSSAFTDEKVQPSFSAFGNSYPIELRLAETIEWCLPLANPLFPKESLRSEALRPVIADTESDYLYTPYERFRSISNLLETRRKLLSGEVSPISSFHDLQGGRLIAYFPDENVCDGASEIASYEFLDVRDAPAWDTWVGLYRDRNREFIVSYIPQKFIEFAQAGIDVNCIDCIEWLENTDTNLATELLNKGIICK